MCGITGIFRFSHGLQQADADALTRMAQALETRGPDGQGLWHEEGIGLGHRRLSIIDLSDNGAQPMASRNGRYVIVYNGEIYNFESIRDELVTEGVTFKSTSDTEVVIEAICHWGIERSLPRFNGMFAFALWDRQLKKLFLARDQMGIKPLYWADIQNGIIFGSEIKSLKQHPEFSTDIDEDALGDFFARSFIASPRSIYKKCHRLQAGSILTVQAEGERSFAPYTPRPSYSYDPAALHGQELSDAFENEMKLAVNRHMRADVPVAAFLSGGNDSALIAALLAQSNNFKTYSVGYKEAEYDESHRAKKIATHLGLEHETIIIGPEETRDHIDKLSSFYDEPFADASALPTHILSVHAEKNHKVALSGDGADELFAGYPRYITAANEWGRLAHIPRMLRPLLSGAIPAHPEKWAQKIAGLVLASPEKSLPYIKKFLAEPSIATHFFKQNYLGVQGNVLCKADMLEIAYNDIAAQRYKGEALRALLSMDQGARLSDAMLTKVDRASMAASLEVRVPYLDRDIIAFSRALPRASMVGHNGICKKLIKDVLARYLPSDIINAPKTGFHIPMKLWLKTHFKDWACDLLSGQDDPYIDMTAARHLWVQYEKEGRDDLFYELWCVLMYRQWLHKSR